MQHTHIIVTALSPPPLTPPQPPAPSSTTYSCLVHTYTKCTSVCSCSCSITSSSLASKGPSIETGAGGGMDASTSSSSWWWWGVSVGGWGREGPLRMTYTCTRHLCVYGMWYHSCGIHQLRYVEVYHHKVLPQSTHAHPPKTPTATEVCVDVAVVCQVFHSLSP